MGSAFFGASLWNSPQFSSHLHPFSNNISLDTNPLDDALDASLIAFTTDIEAAVPSSPGLPLTIR